MAEKMPSGTATTSDRSVMKMVLKMAGSIEQLSEVYLSWKRSSERLGTPFIRI